MLSASPQTADQADNRDSTAATSDPQTSYSIMKDDNQIPEEGEDPEASDLATTVEQTAPLPLHSVQDNVNNRLPYLKSTDFRELLASAVFFLLCLSIYFGQDSLANQQRSIPVQYLAGTNEYVVNLDNNAEILSETVTSTALVIWTQLVPVVLQLLLSKVKGFRRLGDTHATGCVYLVALGSNHFATESIKLYVGWLRPVFLSVCEPSEDYQTCTNDPTDVTQARLSFVSGHASSAFCGLMLLSRYIHERFGLPAATRAQIDSETTPRSRSLYLGRFVSMLSLLPLAVATFIACSRVVDNRHFPADVVGGAVLGGSIALFVHGLWL